MEYFYNCIEAMNSDKDISKSGEKNKLLIIKIYV